MTTLLIVAGGFYSLTNVALAIGMWRRRPVPQTALPPVSVIVAARNEERTLPALLDRLSRQSYPSAEFIIVNDRSTDRTAEVIASVLARDSRFQRVVITAIQDDMPAKKNALRAGIARSTGEILCFTDADCLPGPDWIASLVRCFEARTGMVAGYSPYLRRPEGSEQRVPATLRWLSAFISYEEFRGAVWAAGAIGWNLAWLCTGRNLAYRRSVYDEVGGFEGIKRSVSGDDDLFMQLVRRKTSWGVRFCFDRANRVDTYPAGSFRAFVEQRKRHFSAGKFFSFPMKAFFAAYHSANLVLLAVFAGSLVLADMQPYLLAAIGLKVVPDAVLVASGSQALRERRPLATFIVMELAYVFYNWLLGPLGFTTSFRWKPSK